MCYLLVPLFHLLPPLPLPPHPLQDAPGNMPPLAQRFEPFLQVVQVYSDVLGMVHVRCKEL